MVNIAQYGILTLLAIALILHVGVLLRLIPYDIVWGGRLKSDKEMVRFEVVSILINCLLIGIILINAQLLPLQFPSLLMTVLLWIMAALFFINTIGNLFSKNKLERTLFTPITLLLTVFSVILALQ